ncbi:hypothetical protein [Flexivirga oryzae]|uniref:Uncharacterized protein n=1 Tax=Flexivirga oryzae TaxID=1794944 RepID=A0A839N3N8_9MICO|nr:hypothetical protein [Flexivirga oryzae]MBB2890674.1 hypothetical protein [Flexivirga oryzae]
MSAIAFPAPVRAEHPSTLAQLARLEAVRYAKHPLFLLGFALALVCEAGTFGPIELDRQVVPAFFIGLLGIVVGARLTRTIDRANPLLESVPTSEATRTAALCLACSVPMSAGLVTVLFHRAFLAANPVPDFTYGTYHGWQLVIIQFVLPVLACAGGPLLGVAVGRWLRLPGAALLSLLVVMVWSMIVSYAPMQNMDANTWPSRILHLAGPYTAWASSDASELPPTTVTSFTGSTLWFAVWTVALCALAACGALWHDRGARSRRLLSVGLGWIAIALVALVLAVLGGNTHLFNTTVDGTVPTDTAAQ